MKPPSDPSRRFVGSRRGFVEDFVGGLRPDEWSWVVAPVGEPGPDVAFGVLDGAVDTALELLLREFGELRLPQVQPGRTRRCEVQVEAGMCQQPLLDGGCLVGDVVVENQVYLEVGGHFLVQLGQELL